MSTTTEEKICPICKNTRIIRTETDDHIVEKFCHVCIKLKLCKNKHDPISFYSAECPICELREIICNFNK